MTFTADLGQGEEVEPARKKAEALGIKDIYIEDVVERRAFEFDGAVTAGDSGAPIFGETGDVLGIVYARSRERGVGFAVSTTEIRPVLDSITDSRADTGRCI